MAFSLPHVGRSLRRVAAACLLGPILLALAGPTQAADRSLAQFWPEVDVYFRVGNHWRVLLMGSVTRAADTGVSTETTLGVNLDYFHTALPPAWVNAFPGVEEYWGLTTRVGYNRIVATNPSGSPEDRGVVEATVRSKPVWYDIVLANRVRADLRWIDDAFSWRGRNRTRIERSWALPVWTAPLNLERPIWQTWRSATPYLMAEFFWDSRYSDWTREFYQVGVEFETHKGHSWDFFVARQNDVRTTGSRITVGGIALAFRY